MNYQNNLRKLLEEELKKLRNANNIQISEKDTNWILNIKDTEITIPKINNSVIRKTMLTNK